MYPVTFFPGANETIIDLVLLSPLMPGKLPYFCKPDL